MRAGDRVELRSPTEILETLDDQGCLEGLPFMPEMLGFFGRALTVTAQVERACDTVQYTGVRRLKETVLLDDLRCDGASHAGCGAQCRLYWKTAWLQPLSVEERPSDSGDGDALARLARLATASIQGRNSTPQEPTFRCQATELLRASEQVGSHSVRSLVHEFTSGNVGFWLFVRVTAGIVTQEIGRRLGIVTAAPFRPRELTGQRSITNSTARELRPGELVQIRTKREIGETLDENGKSRGLWFDREMVPYCNRTARVKAKVERFIDEESGRLVELASDCYILDEVVCKSYQSANRWFCPRAIYPWWRGAWLRPVDLEGTEPPADDPAG